MNLNDLERHNDRNCVLSAVAELLVLYTNVLCMVHIRNTFIHNTGITRSAC